MTAITCGRQFLYSALLITRCFGLLHHVECGNVLDFLIAFVCDHVLVLTLVAAVGLDGGDQVVRFLACQAGHHRVVADAPRSVATATTGGKWLAGHRITEWRRLAGHWNLGSKVHGHLLYIDLRKTLEHLLFFYVTATAVLVFLRCNDQVNGLLSGEVWDSSRRTDTAFTMAFDANSGNDRAFAVGSRAFAHPLRTGNGFQRRQTGIIAGNIGNVRFAHFGGHFLQRRVMPPAFAVGVHGFHQVFSRLRRQVGNFGGLAPSIHSMAAGTIGLGNNFAGGKIDHDL